MSDAATSKVDAPRLTPERLERFGSSAGGAVIDRKRDRAPAPQHAVSATPSARADRGGSDPA
jgi:hypothetical protein